MEQNKVINECPGPCECVSNFTEKFANRWYVFDVFNLIRSHWYVNEALCYILGYSVVVETELPSRRVKRLRKKFLNGFPPRNNKQSHFGDQT